MHVCVCTYNVCMGVCSACLTVFIICLVHIHSNYYLSYVPTQLQELRKLISSYDKQVNQMKSEIDYKVCDIVNKEMLSHYKHVH